MEPTSIPSFFVPLTVLTCAAAVLLPFAVTSHLHLPTWTLTTAAEPTDLFAWGDRLVADTPPRQRRRGRSSQPVERTRPVSATTPEVHSATVFEVPLEPPQSDTRIGDVVSSGEHPLFDQDPSDEVLNVVVNVSAARQEQGQRAVRVLDRRGQVLLQLTAAHAHQLAVDLQQSADVVGGIRQAAGFST